VKIYLLLLYLQQEPVTPIIRLFIGKYNGKYVQTYHLIINSFENININVRSLIKNDFI
jgi:hypothetical protein